MHSQLSRIGEMEVTHRCFEAADFGPNDDDFIDMTAIELERHDGHDGHLYVNPAWTIKTPKEFNVDHFLAQSRDACINWKKQLAQTLYSSFRRRIRNLNKSMGGENRKQSILIYRYAYGGLLFLSGRPAHPKRLALQSPKRVKRPAMSPR